MLLLEFIFEVSKIEKFLILMFFILFLLTILSMVYLEIFHIKKFYFFILLVLFLIVLNIYICFSLNLISSLIALIITSFLSLFSIIIGYGISFEVCFLVFFKLLGDLFLMLYMGSYLFFVTEWEVLLFGSFQNFSFSGTIFLILAFGIYSLCCVFGFWIYWAMEGSYFVSSYLHSVGFIFISVMIFMKVYYLGMMEDYFFLVYKLEVIFFFSFLFFLFCFMAVKKLKKSFGYFSCSSVCYVFMILVNSPTMSLIYFFLSSFFKVLFFELAGILFISKTLPSSNLGMEWAVSIEGFKSAYSVFSKFYILGNFNNNYFINKDSKILFKFMSMFFLSSLLFLYSEFSYFYLNYDLFLDFSYLGNLMESIFNFSLFFKLFGIFNLLVKLVYMFMKVYLMKFSEILSFESFPEYEKPFLLTEDVKEFLKAKKLFFQIELILFNVMFFCLSVCFIYFFYFSFHNFNSFIILTPLWFFVSDFYSIFKMSSLELSMKILLYKLNLYFFHEVYFFKFKFNYSKVSIKNISIFNLSDSSVHVGYTFFCMLLFFVI